MDTHRIKGWFSTVGGLQLTEKDIAKVYRGPLKSIVMNGFVRRVRSPEFIDHMRSNLYINLNKDERKNAQSSMNMQKQKEELRKKEKQFKKLNLKKSEIVVRLEQVLFKLESFRMQDNSQNLAESRLEFLLTLSEFKNETINQFFTQIQISQSFDAEKTNLDELLTRQVDRIKESCSKYETEDELDEESINYHDIVVPSTSSYNLSIWLNRIDSEKSVFHENTENIQSPIMLLCRAAKGEIQQFNNMHINLVVKNKYTLNSLKTSANSISSKESKEFVSNREILQHLLIGTKRKAQLEYCKSKSKEISETDLNESYLIQYVTNSKVQNRPSLYSLINTTSRTLDNIKGKEIESKDCIKHLMVTLGNYKYTINAIP